MRKKEWRKGTAWPAKACDWRGASTELILWQRRWQQTFIYGHGFGKGVEICREESVPAKRGSTRCSHDRCLSRFLPQTFIFRGLWVCSKNPLRVYTWFTPGLCLPKFILTTFLCSSSSGGSGWIKLEAHWFPVLPRSFTTRRIFLVDKIRWVIIMTNRLPSQSIYLFILSVVLARCCWKARVS